MKIKKFDICPRYFDSVDELAHEDAIADEQGLFHRAGRNLKSLNDKRPDKTEDEYKGNCNHLKVFPYDGSLKFLPTGQIFADICWSFIHQYITSNNKQN